jgi:hypothetical protein
VREHLRSTTQKTLLGLGEKLAFRRHRKEIDVITLVAQGRGEVQRDALRTPELQAREQEGNARARRGPIGQ